MKKYFYNLGYFLKEVKNIISLNLLSNMVTLLSIALILFILTMVISGWWISGDVLGAIQEEAEISVYFDEKFSDEDIAFLIKDIKIITGVKDARLVEEIEAHERMEKILGKEAQVLEYFDDNPFSSFIEVNIQLDKVNIIIESLNDMRGIEYIRDNREVLNRLQNISEIFSFLGILVVAAAGMTTLVIISHIIRLGIHANREQINTLRLLGAPEGFIAFPFLLAGLFLTIGGSIIAVSLSGFILKHIYGQISGPLPFIPLPSFGELISNLRVLIIVAGGLLGLVGGLFGLLSTRKAL